MLFELLRMLAFIGKFYFENDAQCMKRALMHFADNVGPDYHAHLCSLIWAFSVRQHILQYSLIL